MSPLHPADVFVPRALEVSTGLHSYSFLPARIALVGTLIAAPWAFGAVEAWAWMSLGLGACVTVLLWIAGALHQKMLRLRWSPLYIPLAAFFLLALTQYLVGDTLDKSETREALVLFAVDATFFFTAVQLLGDSGGRAGQTFGFAVLLFAGTLGLFAILQFASGTPYIYWTIDSPFSFGPYGNPDHYAGLMEMLIPVAACYIASQWQKCSTMVLLVLISAATVAVVSLLLTGSRGGLLALSAEIAMAGVILGRRVRNLRTWSLTATTAGAVVAVLLLFYWVDPGWVAPHLGKIVDVSGQDKAWADELESRKRFALDSLRMLHDHPAFGVGLGNFEIAYPLIQSFPNDLTVDAHNDYLQAAAETGMAGAALILSALALFFRLAFHDLTRRLQSANGWIRLGAALGCCGLLVHSLFDFNLHIPANAAWFAVLAGVASVPYMNGKVQFETGR